MTADSQLPPNEVPTFKSNDEDLQASAFPVRRFSRNVAFSVSNMAVAMLSGLILLPITLHQFGATMFGVWALAMSISAYLSMLDLGLNITLTKRVAEAFAQGDDRGGKTISVIASTIFGIYILIGLISACSLLLFALPTLNVFRLNADQFHVFQLAIALLALQGGLGFPFSVWNSILCGLQDYHLLYLCSIVATLVRLVAALLFLRAGIGVVGFVALGAIIALALSASNYAVARYRLPDLRIRPSGFRWTELRNITSFNGSMAVLSLAGYSFHQGDRVILGFVASPQTVASYDIGARLAIYSRSIIQAWLDLLIPHAADSTARGKGGLATVYINTTRIIVLTYGAVTACTLVAGPQLMTWWLGPGHQASFNVLLILVVANLYQSQTLAGHMLLIGSGKVRALTIVVSGYPLLVASCGIIMAHRLGAAGMAGALLITVTVLETTFLVVLLRSLRFSMATLLKTCHLPLAICLGVSWLAGQIALGLIHKPLLGSAILACVVTLLAYASSAVATGITRSERATIWRLLKPGRADG